MFFLCTSSSAIAECFLALVCYVLPVASLNLILREEFRAHSYAEYASLEPLFEVFLLWCHAAGNHDFGPRHGSHETLYEVRTNDIAWEYLCEVATNLLRFAYF